MCSDWVLQIEHSGKWPIEPVGPEVSAGLALDELTADPHALAGLAHAAFQDVADAKFAADPPDVDHLALVGEGRIAGYHEQRLEARQRRYDVLDHAVGEVLLLRITAYVLERQHGDRRPLEAR